MSATLTANLVHFVRHLRSRGLSVVPATVEEMAAAVEAVGLARRDDVKAAFAAIAVNRPTERTIFDEAFEAFFGLGAATLAAHDEDVPLPLPQDTQPQATSPVLAEHAPDHLDPDEAAVEMPEHTTASYDERLMHRDFRDLTAQEAEEVRRIMSRIVWRPSEAASRRWTASPKGIRPDMRRTMRNLVGPGADMMQLAMAERKPRRRPLIVLADVSGSMETYTEMFLHFLHAAQGRMGRLETFVFATHLSRITRELRQKLPDVALRQVSAAVDDWSGGTRIGEAIGQFNEEWSRRVTRGGAIGLVISDGWDTGEPELLGREMARFHRSM
ncbi:MAG: VWA domain-containing protein, partial [Acidimicrobiia bacterium]|nr:VWA domain-containing protein [Acidimicrobiia bacterium]